MRIFLTVVIHRSHPVKNKLYNTAVDICQLRITLFDVPTATVSEYFLITHQGLPKYLM